MPVEHTSTSSDQDQTLNNNNNNNSAAAAVTDQQTKPSLLESLSGEELEEAGEQRYLDDLLKRNGIDQGKLRIQPPAKSVPWQLQSGST